MKICRRSTFNAAHRLFKPEWDDSKNELVFGKCSNPNYHGHNYVVETWVEGEIDPETGYVLDLKILKDIIKEEISDRFDHANLNLDCKEFENLIPTTENITVVIWNLLRKRLDDKFKVTIKVWETENNVCEYSGL